MIKFLVMDVDGTLTDGKVYMGKDGEAFKAFDIKDGCGIKVLLPQQAIIPIIITARKSVMLEHRCKELDIKEIHQGVREKLDCLKNIIQKYSSDGHSYSLTNCAYIGDDILDLQCMKPIKEAGGLACCPADAINAVVKACEYVSSHNAGEGAVRDCIEYILCRNQRLTTIYDDRLKTRLDNAVEYISRLDFETLKVGKYEVSPDFFYTVQEYITFDENEAQYESHKKYIDIQWVYEGIERLYITDINGLFPSDEYDEEKDVIHYFGTDNMSSMLLTSGSCAILFPKDAHKPGKLFGSDGVVKKVVGKLLI